MHQNKHEHWVQELQAAFTDPLKLLESLELTANDVGLLLDGNEFPFRVPRPFAARIETGTPRDPLLLQVLPSVKELTKAPGFGRDPVGDLSARRSPALLQKYHARALIIVTGGCAINCRYCFRRHFPYATSLGTRNLELALSGIRSDASLKEVILSGGDPLLLSDDQLSDWVTRLDEVAHVKRLRIHTRLPVTIPSRITPALTASLANARLKPVVVVHINHPNEIDDELANALVGLAKSGIQLLNQTVLLRGVNDSAETLATLSESLFAASVLPYYVHLLDPVEGAAHFDTDEDSIREIVARLHTLLPGYLVPRFVREIAGEKAKTPFV